MDDTLLTYPTDSKGFWTIFMGLSPLVIGIVTLNSESGASIEVSSVSCSSFPLICGVSSGDVRGFALSGFSIVTDISSNGWATRTAGLSSCSDMNDGIFSGVVCTMFSSIRGWIIGSIVKGKVRVMHSLLQAYCLAIIISISGCIRVARSGLMITSLRQVVNKLHTSCSWRPVIHKLRVSCTFQQLAGNL